MRFFPLSAFRFQRFTVQRVACTILSLFLIFSLSAPPALADLVLDPLPEENSAELFVDPSPVETTPAEEETLPINPSENEEDALFAPFPEETSSTLFADPDAVPEEENLSTISETEIPVAKGGEIGISEVVTNPEEGEEEWVELVLLVDEERNLSGLFLFDATQKIYTFPEDTILYPGEFLVCSGWGSKLNNTGDSVFVKNADGEILASAENIPALEKGESWLPEESILGIPTPGADNEPAQNVPEEEENPDSSADPLEETTTEVVVSSFAVGEIRINEVVTNPEIGEEEWIELVSLVSEEKSLAGYTLFDASQKIYSFSSDATLAPGVFLVVSGWGSKLNNTGDSVFLKDANGDSIAAVEHIPALEKGQSWLPEESVLGIPTAGAENEWVSDPSSSETEVVSEENIPGGVVINEIMSHPTTGEEEWVELFSTAETPFDLGGFFLADSTGTFYEIPDGTLLLPETYLVLSGWSNKLNNSGDSVSLLSSTKTEVVAPVVFPALKTEYAWALAETGYRTTNIPTPGQENRFPTVILEEESETGSRKMPIPSLAKTAASRPSPRAEDIVLRISEALFHGTEEDFVELFCEECNVDLAGIRVGDDDTFFEFPEGSIVPTGAFVVLHLAKEPQESWHNENIWHFWTEKTGLTGTDETLFVLDSLGTVEDGLCIANQNGTFSPGEEDDVVRLIRDKAFTGIHPLSEAVCFDSQKLGKDRSLVVIPEKRGTSAQNAFDGVPTPGEPNPLPPLQAESVSLQLSDAFLLPDGSVSIRLTNTGSRLISLDGFALSAGEERTVFASHSLFAGESFFAEVHASGTDRVVVHDSWGTSVAEFPLSEVKTFSSGSHRLVISEILANPDGVDAGNEFLELQCLAEECLSNEFAVFVGGKRVPFSDKLKQGEYATFSDVSLRNSDLLVQVFDCSLGQKDEFLLESSHSGESVVRFQSRFIATTFPTPGADNRIVSEESNSDSDHDGIPDASEFVLGSDPLEKNAWSSVEYRLFQSLLRAGVSVTAEETPDGILFTGKALPETEIHLVLHSDIVVISTTTDRKGNFSVLSHPNIAPGTHHTDVVLTPKNGAPLLVSNITQLHLEKNPREGWLSDVDIVQALPNPTGKDSGRESIMLRNKENRSGVLAGAILKSGNREMLLPRMEFLPGQARVLSADDIPSLRNTNGEVSLINVDGKVISSVSWKSAKEGRWIGEEAPMVPTKVKATKTKKRVRSSSKTVSDVSAEDTFSSPIRQEFQGIFGGIRDNTLVLIKENGEETLYPLSNRLSPHLLGLLLTEGEHVVIVLEDGMVFSVDALPLPAALSLPVMSESGISLFLVVSLIAGALFLLLPWGIRFVEQMFLVRNLQK